VADLSGTLDLDAHIDILEDVHGDLSIDDVVHVEHSGRFEALRGRSPNFGFTGSTWWARVAFSNQSDTATTVLLRQDYPLIDELAFYSENSSGQRQVIETGDRRPFASRDIDHQHFIFRVPLQAGETRTVHLKFATGGSMNIGLSASTESTLLARIGREQLGYGLYYGGFLVLLFYNLFIFIAVRDRAFFYYLLYLASYGTYFAVHNGLTFQFLWPNSPWWGNKSLVVLLSLTLFWGIKFSRSILQSERTSPRIDRAAAGLQWLSALGLVGAIALPYAKIILPLAAISILVPPVLIAMGIAGLFAGHQAARYFLFAWSTLLVGVVVYMLKSFGILPHNFVTQNGFQIGALLE
ncbi:MAG: 7TM diverse intracellular signaling domain-containing protein, partial [Pseudomonadota bacterium]